MQELRELFIKDKGLLSLKNEVNVILMTHRTFGSFLKTMFEIMGMAGYKTTAYMQGRLSSLGVEGFIRKHYGGFEGISKLYSEIGWGEIKVMDSGDSMVFEWVNNPVALALKAAGIKSNEPMCYFSAGYIHGLVEGLVEGRKVKRVVEESCIVKGDDKCTFKVEFEG